MNRFLVKRDITPESLSTLLSNMRPGERLVMALDKNNVVRMYMEKPSKTGKKETEHFRNLLFSRPRPEPIKHAWFPASLGEPTDKDYAARKKHKKIVEKKATRSNSAKRNLLASLCMEMYGKTLEDGTPITLPNGSFWFFEIGDFVVYCKSNLKPVMWKEGNGEMVYAPVETKKSDSPSTRRLPDGRIYEESVPA